MEKKVTQVLVGVHPISHKFEWEPKGRWGRATYSPALRATDYKCPHCVLLKYGETIKF